MFGPLLTIRHFLYNLFTRKSHSIPENNEAGSKTLLPCRVLSPRQVTLLTSEKNCDPANEIPSIGKSSKCAMTFYERCGIFELFITYKDVFNEKWMIKKFFWCMSLYTGVMIIVYADHMAMLTAVIAGVGRLSEEILSNCTNDVKWFPSNYYACTTIMYHLSLVLLLNVKLTMFKKTEKSVLNFLYGFIKLCYTIRSLFCSFVYSMKFIFSDENNEYLIFESASECVIFGYSWMIVHSQAFEIEHETKHSESSSTGVNPDVLDRKSENRATNSDHVQPNEINDSKLVDVKSKFTD